MPEVPTLSNFSVSPQGTTGARFDAAPQTDTSARQTQQFGGALQEASAQAGAIATDAQAQANQLRVDDALNQVKETALDLTFDPNEGYTTLKGEAALHRPEGQTLQQEYGAKLQTAIDSGSEGLSNDAQRRAFTEGAASIHQNFTAGIDQHYTQQFETYTRSVDTGIIATAQRDIALNPTDADTIAKANLRIDAATARSARLAGTSADEAEATARSFKSQAYGMALANMIDQNNLPLAQDFLATHRGDMDAADIINYDAKVTDGVRANSVNNFVANLFANTTGGAPHVGAGGPSNDMDRMVAITAQSESGGKDRDAAGGLITSPVGAQGMMQVMPATARDPGYGIKPAQDGSDAERNRVGQQLLAKFVQIYGDPAKAWAAYNWSKGGVDKCVAEYGSDWLSHCPAETRAYVTKNTAALGGGSNGAPRQSLSTLLQIVDTEYAGDPRARELATQQVTTRYNAVKADHDQGDEDAVNGAYQQLYQNGGAVTPAIAQSVPGKYLPAIQTYAKAVRDAKTKVVDDPILWAGLRTQIADKQITDPAQLMKYAPKLSNTQYEGLTNDIIAVHNRDAKRLNSFKTTSDTLTFVRSEMTAAGVDWTKQDNPAYLQYREALYKQVDTLEKVAGRPLTEDESRGVALKLLQQTQTLGGKSTRGYQLDVPGLPLGVVPEDVRAHVIAALHANHKPATEYNVRWVLAHPDADLAGL